MVRRLMPAPGRRLPYRSRNQTAVERVAVTGMGIVSPIGEAVEVFWQHLLEGKCGIAPMKASGPKVSGNGLWAAVADDFLDRSPDPSGRSCETPTASLSSQWRPQSKRSARHRSNRRRSEPRSSWATRWAAFPSSPKRRRAYSNPAAGAVSPKLMALVIPNMPSALIAMHWKLHGPQLAISTACASSLDAIGLASGMIERGEIDAAIVGGSETLLSPLVYESLVRAGALSRNTDATRASRPFDVDRDGFVMGDGAAILVLERIERAWERGARVLARIRGYGSLSDAYHITSPDPSARYEVRAMQDAIERAGDAGEQCAVVYAHATSTIVGDAAEAKAIDAVYADRPAIVTSIKGHVGHSMASAGAMCAIAGIAGMHEECIPPTIGTQRLDPATHFDLVIEAPARRIATPLFR